MKKILLLAAIISLCLSSFAQKSVQSIRYEGALAQAITQERYNRLLSESPSKLVATYYEVTKFCYVSNQLPESVRVMGDFCDFVSPNEACDDAATVASTKQINPRKYTMTRDDIRYNAYTIGSTGYYVIVYPSDVYTKNYSAFMKEYGF